MKTFVCLVLVATCALAIPLNQEQSPSTDAPSNGHFGDRIPSSTKQTAQTTQNHPASSHAKRHSPASLSDSTDSKPEGTSTGSSHDHYQQNRPSQLKSQTTSSDNWGQTSSSSSSTSAPSVNSQATKTKRDTQNAPAVPAATSSQVPSAIPKKPVTKAPVAARVTKARRDLPTSSNGATAIKKQPLPVKTASSIPTQAATATNSNAGQPAKAAVVPAVAQAASTKN